jgi:adenosylcobinamide-GDP ribazoletransferase
MKNFITALQFLTVVRVKKDHPVEEGDLAKSMVYFPLIGFLIGLILIYADKAFAFIVLPQNIANLLLIVIILLVTRALHIDGLADTLDGLMGGRDQASRLEIMKDSRLGTAGVLGIVCVLSLKYMCLNNLYNSEKIAALLTAPALARWSQTFMAFGTNYGRGHGMGKAFVGHLRTESFAVVSAIAAGLTAFVIVREDVRSLALFICLIVGVVLTSYVGRRYLVRKLGGMTGDAIGAVSELNEALVFLIFVIFSNGI